MSRKAKAPAGPPPPTLTFKAGGKKSSPSSNKTKESNGTTGCNQLTSPRTQPSPGVPSSGLRSNNYAPPPITTPLSIVQTGLSQKRSPFQIKNWIACVLTLDGRDKFTKVLQYTSRLLTWYFAGLAKKTSVGGALNGASSVAAASAVMGSSASILNALYTNIELRQQYYMALSKRFDSLYKSLVTSRKAFRMGRSIIELDKLSSMGWGDYLRYMLLHPLAGGVADDDDDGGDGGEERKVDVGRSGEGMGSTGTLARYDTHPILEEEEEGHDEDDDATSWNEDETSASSDGEEDDDGLPTEEKKLDVPSSTAKKVKAVSRPGRPKLPTRISSNVGWGPSTATTQSKATSNTMSPTQSKSKPPVSRTVSEMGRQMYKPFPSRSSSMGSYTQVKGTTPSTLDIQLLQPQQPATPSWKLIGGTIKLLGLMGFWAFDNLSFLTGTGFLDPINGGSDGVIVDPKAKDRMKRKTHLSEWAGRCYFIGGVAGLYVNTRALWDHRNGLLKQARARLDEAVVSTTITNSSENGNTDGNVDNIKEANAHLQQTSQKHFELFLALLKSCCDVMVFSNNPGIDLHLKLRGKKNHEGLHCVGGLISAGTVLYTNFPNAAK